jgi:hypothetical protein
MHLDLFIAANVCGYIFVAGIKSSKFSSYNKDKLKAASPSNLLAGNGIYLLLAAVLIY